MKAKQWALVGLAAAVALALVGGYLFKSVEVGSLQSTIAYQQEVLKRQAEVLLQLRRAAVPRNFEDYTALKAWVDNWESVNKPIAVGDGKRSFVLTGSSVVSSEYWDCDDVADAMQRCAMTDGYMMSVVLVDRGGKVYGIRVSSIVNHAGCMAVAEGTYYYVEPFTGEITKITERD